MIWNGFLLLNFRYCCLNEKEKYNFCTRMLRFSLIFLSLRDKKRISIRAKEKGK